MRAHRPSSFSSPQNMYDPLRPLDALRTQKGHFSTRKSYGTLPAGSQYLRLWGHHQELSADDWGAQQLVLAPELPIPASVPRPWRGPEPVSVPRLSSRRRPQHLKY